ncbi:MAG: alpha/beta hydrolase [Gammaproteobacteria bacterium]
MNGVQSRRGPGSALGSLVRGVIIVSLALAFAGGLALLLAADWLTHSNPTALAADPPGLNTRDVEIPAADGVILRGTLVRPKATRGGVLLLHQRGGNRSAMWSRARILLDAGYTCLLMDQRAEGASDGTRRGFGLLEAPDIGPMLDALRKAVDGRPMAVLGVSKGAVATTLASLPEDVKAVVLESAFGTLENAIELRIREAVTGVHGALEFLTVLTPVLVGVTEWVAGVDADDRPVDRVAGLRSAVLVITGDRDPFVPLETARAMARKTEGALLVVEGAGHRDVFRKAPDIWSTTVIDFLGEHLR